jgi:ribonuclease VapC
MIADASALVGILAEEPDAHALLVRLGQHPVRYTHGISIFETVAALMRIGGRPRDVVERVVIRFLSQSEIDLLAIGPAETAAALDAFARYGKGRHPAALNMGDCFSYACARTRGMPLLYKGEDFAKTDLAPA